VIPLDLGVPEPGTRLVVPVDPFLHGVDVNEGQGARAWQQRRPPGQFREGLPAAFSSWLTLPQVTTWSDETPGQTSEVFTFGAELGRRGLAGVLATG
jgi:hypothetical protein